MAVSSKKKSVKVKKTVKAKQTAKTKQTVKAKQTAKTKKAVKAKKAVSKKLVEKTVKTPKAKSSKVAKPSKVASTSPKAKTSKTGKSTTNRVAQKKISKSKAEIVAKKVTTTKPKTKTTKSIKKPSRKAVKTMTETIQKTTPETAEGLMPYQIKQGEEYMSPNMLQHFRDILNLRKQQLMEEVDSTVIHMKEEAASYPDPLDRAAQEEGFNLELRTRDRERRLIKKIEQALDMIDDGEYGYCEDCGAEIGVRRLEARPTADKCIDCKTFEEIREKQGNLGG